MKLATDGKASKASEESVTAAEKDESGLGRGLHYKGTVPSGRVSRVDVPDRAGVCGEARKDHDEK